MNRTLTTDRLVLRSWRDSDRKPFAEMNADPEVMRHFPSTLTRDESDSLVDKLIAREVNDGITFWAVERLSDNQFIGFTGLSSVGFTAPFTPNVEVGWRLARHAWGNGHATEAALASLDFAWNVLDRPEVVAFIVPPNLPSKAVAERIGMTTSPADDFSHPNVDPSHHLSRHELWRIVRGA